MGELKAVLEFLSQLLTSTAQGPEFTLPGVSSPFL